MIVLKIVLRQYIIRVPIIEFVWFDLKKNIILPRDKLHKYRYIKNQNNWKHGPRVELQIPKVRSKMKHAL